jgi:hypothetical protein
MMDRSGEKEDPYFYRFYVFLHKVGDCRRDGVCITQRGSMNFGVTDLYWILWDNNILIFVSRI